MRARSLFLVLPLIALPCAGCGEARIEYTERKRLDEVLTPGEVATFLRIVEALPAEPLGVVQHAFRPVPDWDRRRTLPVSDLVREERESLENGWDTGWLARHEKPSRRLERTLARERLTYEQFVALALSIGASLSRATLREDQDLERMIARGRAEWTDLELDDRPFAALSAEERHRTLQRAAWVARAERAERLGEVPIENAEVVGKFRERLEPYFPSTFLENPFDAILDPLDEYGVPFEEPIATRDDALLRWSPAEAIVGSDAPDPEFDDPTSLEARTRRLTHGPTPRQPGPAKP